MTTPANQHRAQTRALRRPPARSEPARGAEHDSSTPGFGIDLTAIPANGTHGAPLDPTTRTQMESRFGHDFSAVRTHTGPAADTSTRTLRARAYTVGTDLVFRDGTYRPGTPAGDHLLAHELAHVVQQTRGTNTGARQDSTTTLEQAARASADTAVAGLPVRVLGASAERVSCEDEDQPVYGPPTLEQYLLKTDPALQIITWNDRFRKGFQTAEVGKAAAEAINAAMNNSHDPMFSLGFTVGVPAGVWEDLVGQLKALVFLGLLPGQLLAKLYLDPTGFKQAAQQLADLPMKTLAGAEPLGKKTGEFLADRARELATASPYDQGYSIGKVVGYLVAEIALLFIGVEAVSAAAKALRATALGTQIGKFVEGSRVLKPLVEMLSVKKAETVVEDAAKAGKVVEESHVPTKPATEAPPSTKPATEAPPSTKTPTEAPPSTKTKDPAVKEPELTTGAKQEIKNASNTPGTKEYLQRVDDLAKDPAKGGAISPQSKREAVVGLAAEHDGLIPGPISRAPKGPKGEDLGEFIDGAGDRWDVKSSPDAMPSYRPGAGKPISNPQTDAQFTSMIEKDLATGEKVLIDPDGMSPARRTALEQLVANNPQWRGKVVWGK